MAVTGERVMTMAGGFNPTWQRHVAAYKVASGFLGPGRIVDVGCGIGHSFELLAPRETVGVDVDPEALEGQPRETVVADMRALPFADGEFDGAIAVQSIEHVPEAGPALAEIARVVAPEAVSVLVTPNRLTMGTPSEVVDPYHYVEYDPEEMRDACEQHFPSVEIHGLFGSPRYMEIWNGEMGKLDALLRRDPLRLRRLMPRRLRQRLYDWKLGRERRDADPHAAEITPDDFELRSAGLEACLDLVAVCCSPRR